MPRAEASEICPPEITARERPGIEWEIIKARIASVRVDLIELFTSIGFASEFSPDGISHYLKKSKFPSPRVRVGRVKHQVRYLVIEIGVGLEAQFLGVFEGAIDQLVRHNHGRDTAVFPAGYDPAVLKGRSLTTCFI